MEYLTSVGLITKDHQSLLNLIEDSSGYVLCPGIEPEWYEQRVKTAGYQREEVREFHLPVKRYESVECLLWHKPCNTYTQLEDHLFNVFSSCNEECRRVVQNAERSLCTDETIKDARRSVLSKYPMSKLSPNSQTVKIKRIKKENQAYKQKVQKLLEKTS